MSPLVSLILCVKNGMPYLPDALASVAGQSYRNIELVVQDAESNDETLEAVAVVTNSLSAVEVVSEPDAGIGDAYNRAVARCHGEIVGSIDADNVLLPDAVQQAVEFLGSRPTTAAVYGGSNMLAPDGEILYPWLPDEFDLLRLLACELVPPFAVSFFNRRICGQELRFDPSLRTCADFDLWLRLSELPIERMSSILGGTRLSDASMTRREETYDQYIVDKTDALERFLGRFEPSALIDSARARSLAGLHFWSAESIWDIAGARNDRFERYLARALQLDPGSKWGKRLSELPSTRVAPQLEEPTEAPQPRSPQRGGWLLARLRDRQSSANSDV
jgi:glycosyltransferase involved in cell wall biosynthesis